jgi:hypothetical protein
MNDSSFFIQSNFSQRYNGNIAQLCSLSREEHSSSGVSKDVLDFLAKSGKILSSNSGLILCRSTIQLNDFQVFISNQATRTWLPIPLPEQLQPINV